MGGGRRRYVRFGRGGSDACGGTDGGAAGLSTNLTNGTNGLERVRPPERARLPPPPVQRCGVMNPVRARLVARAGDWPWSSARAHLAGEDDGLVTVGPLNDRVVPPSSPTARPRRPAPPSGPPRPPVARSATRSSSRDWSGVRVGGWRGAARGQRRNARRMSRSRGYGDRYGVAITGSDRG